MPPSIEGQVEIQIANSVLYGIYLTTLLVSLRWLLYAHDNWKPWRHVNWGVLIVTFAIFVSTSLDTAWAWRREILVVRNPSGGPAPDQWSNTGQSFLSHLQTLMVDAVLTYRCWIIYRKSWVSVVFPMLLWCACFAVTVVRACWQAGESTRMKQVVAVILSFWTCSIVLNLYATVLIVYKIIRIAKFKNLPTRHVLFAMRVIVESGLMYTITAIMLFIAGFFDNTFAQFFLSTVNFQLVGIAFNLIVIRLSPVDGDHPLDMIQEPLTTVNLSSGSPSHASPHDTVGEVDKET